MYVNPSLSLSLITGLLTRDVDGITPPPVYHYCAKEEGQPITLCRFNPIRKSYTKLFPLSALGPNVERLRNGVYINGTPK